MKIALVVPGGVDRSGSERVIPCLLWMIERLARDHEVHVFALHQESRAGQWPLLGAIVHNAGPRPRRLRAIASVAREHRRGRFDVIHGFWAGGPGLVAAAFGRLAGVPSVITLPGGDLVALPEIAYGGRLTARGRTWTRLALAGASRLIVPSRSMGALAAGLGVATVHIPWGVALDRWPIRKPVRRLPETQLRLIHVANLNQVKDQPTLLLAMKILRDRGVDFQLDVVGLDCLSGAVQRQCAELALDDRVRFHGFLRQPDTRAVFEQAEILVMSSRHEAVPMVMLEAAVAGVPTVGTAVGQIADWAPHASVAVPLADPTALAAAIETLAGDEEHRLRIAGTAQRLAIAEDADFTTHETLHLYELLR